MNTALPTIQAIFHADLHLASYVDTGYILAAGVVVPLSAFLANRFGIKKIYLGSLAAFTIGSVLCGLAPTITWLIVFRIVQGAGGAVHFPLSFSLLFSTFPQEERGKANGYFGIPVSSPGWRRWDFSGRPSFCRSISRSCAASHPSPPVCYCCGKASARSPAPSLADNFISGSDRAS